MIVRMGRWEGHLSSYYSIEQELSYISRSGRVKEHRSLACQLRGVTGYPCIPGILSQRMSDNANMTVQTQLVVEDGLLKVKDGTLCVHLLLNNGTPSS